MQSSRLSQFDMLQRIPITEEGAGSRRPSYQDDSSAMGGACEVVLMAFSVLLIILTFPLTIFFCIRIVQEYERAVIFRLGRVKKVRSSFIGSLI